MFDVVTESNSWLFFTSTVHHLYMQVFGLHDHIEVNGFNRQSELL